MANSTKVNFCRLSYVVYEHPDLPLFETFAHDFGFEVAGRSNSGDLFLRGYGRDPYVYIARQAPASKQKAFCGAGFVARTEEDFTRAGQMEGAQKLDISGRPGGGKAVRILDPNGFAVEIVFGQKERMPVTRGISSIISGRGCVNGAVEKMRKGMWRLSKSTIYGDLAKLHLSTIGVFNRAAAGPAMIHKLGHFGYATDNHANTCAWYSSNFNFKATDILHKPGDEAAEILVFYHLDLGAEYSDHHCLLIAIHHGNQTETRIHHSSFEVEDLDTQMMGHQWLKEKGYRQMWGVGRHVMGSQIFDYWYDTSDFIVEHYADGDLVNEDVPTCRQAGTPAAIWGPPVPTKWD